MSLITKEASDEKYHWTMSETNKPQVTAMTAERSDHDGMSDETAETVAVDPDEAAADRDEPLPLDVVFGILKNRRRRLVLKHLVEESATSTLSDLAERIAAVENNKSENALSSSERKRVYVCLYQCHLPKMDDADVIDFDDNRGSVELADNVNALTQYLDVEDDEEATRDWPSYYVTLSVVGGGVFIAQRLLLPSDVLSGIIMGVLVGLFFNVALEHAYKHDVLQPNALRRAASGAD